MSLKVTLNNSIFPAVASVHILCYDDREAMYIHVRLVIKVAKIF